MINLSKKMLVTLFVGLSPLWVYAKSPLSSNTPPTSIQLIEAYLNKSGAQAQHQALSEVAQAEQNYAQQWRHGDIDLVVHHETDQFSDDLPSRNWQMGAGFNVLLPDQREARKKVAQLTATQTESQSAWINWQASGALRKLIWALKKAKVSYQQDLKAMNNHRNLLEKVTKQVQVGERSKFDEIIARQNFLEAQKIVRESEQKSKQAQQIYRSWTGFETLPLDIEESKAASIRQPHPLLSNLQAKRAVQDAKMDRVREDASGHPAVFFGMQNDEVAHETNRSVIVEVSVPLGLDTQTDRNLAQENRALVDIEIEIKKAQKQLLLDFENWQTQVVQWQQQVEIHAEQAALAHQALTMAKQAYQLGEINIQNLLEVQQNSLRHQKAYAMAKVALSSSISQLNQSAGYRLGEL